MRGCARKIKPVNGAVTVKTGGVITELPEKGREPELANFAGAYALD